MDDHKHLRINLKVLSVVGLWPAKFDSKIGNHLYRYYCVFVMIYFGVFVITEYIEIIRTLNKDLFDIINNLSVSLLYTVTIVKMKIVKGSHVRGFVEQIWQTERVILDGENEELKRIYLKHVRWNHKLNKLFMSLTLGTILPFFINPKITELTQPIGNYTEIVDNATVYVERPLPFSSWFPFDRFKYYYVSYTLHVIAGTFGAALTCTTDIFYWGFMVFGIGQIKILQYKLRTLKREGEELATINNVSVEEGVTIALKKCIVLHQVIIRYINDLDKSLNFLMLMDFGICSMQIGAIGFQVVVSGFGFSQMFATEYLMAMLIQMFLFYWHANEILLESLQISGALWESDFDEYGKPVHNMLIFMMLRAQKPLTLRVGPFYAMSTATALSIVRAAYSYVALMRQVYN